MESESERGTNLLNMGEELRCVGVVTSLHRLVDALHHWLPPGWKCENESLNLTLWKCESGKVVKVASLHRLVDAFHHWLPPGCGEITFFWEHLFLAQNLTAVVLFSMSPGNLWQPLTRSKKIQKVSLNKKYFKTLLLFTSLRVPQTTTTPRPQGLFVDQWMTNGRVNRTRNKETNKLRNKTNI